VNTPPPDLGGASPLWGILLLAIVAGPFVVAIIYGIKNRRSGSPRDEGTIESAEMMKSLKDWTDVRTGGKGF
jgi:hypothetical protein